MAVPATLEKLKVLLYVGHKAPVQSIEMCFTVRIEKSFSLKVGKDGVEEIKHSHINVLQSLSILMGIKEKLFILPTMNKNTIYRENIFT